MQTTEAQKVVVSALILAIAMIFLIMVMRYAA